MPGKKNSESNGHGESLARGALALIGVQFIYLIGATGMQLYLGRRLGPADYGIFGVVMGFLAWMEAALTGGFPYAVRKFGGENHKLMPGIARSALRGQLFYSLILFITAEIGAPYLAKLLRDPQLTGLIRLASLEIPIYGLYYTYASILNGKRSFTRQAGAMLAYAIGKAGIILLLVVLGFGIRGALFGNVLASGVGFAAGIVLMGRLTRQAPYPMGKLIKYAGSTAIFAVVITLLLSIDLFSIKALSHSANVVGYYTAANTLARAPFYVFIGIATATLPAISGAAAQSDTVMLRRYVGQSLRLHFLLLALVTAVLSSTAVGTIRLLYSERYIAGAPALAVLAASLMLFGFLHSLSNMLLAVGDTKTPIAVCIGTIIVGLGLNALMIPRMGMMGAAGASLATAGIGITTCGSICYKKLGGLIPPVSALRIGASTLLAYGAGKWLATAHVPVLAAYVAIPFVYAISLILMREINRSDLSSIASAAGVSKTKAG